MVGKVYQGSMWHRWDPHIHTPGTILSDQYPANDGWEQFLARVEASDPPVRALGITDYYSTATYQQAVAHKAAGRMQDVDLIFPNVELRLGVGTGTGTPINIHLLVSPEDPEHLDRLHSFLAVLEFEAMLERYRCTPDEIRRLGRAHDPNAATDEQALAAGTNQFKVDLANLRLAFRGSQWARENILIAVPASSNDGTAGLQGDASLTRLRREIESSAQIIFSGRPGDRLFWLGQNPAVPAADIVAQYGALKPCLHGSDAHRPDRVVAPDQDRRCWLKGDISFETLRQACLEPEIRAFVGPTTPATPPPSQVITNVELGNAGFVTNRSFPLNPGLVGIIGARGSGKTALADFIAVGAEAFAVHTNRQSFVDRARDHLGGMRVDLEWGDGTGSGCAIEDLQGFGDAHSPYVRYLSQQFVDRLCSAEGLTDELLEEIQRVIFLAHPSSDRQGAANFLELLALKADTARLSRAHHEQLLRNLSEELVSEQEKAASVDALRAQHATLTTEIFRGQADRLALVSRGGGSEDRLNAYSVVATALQARRSEFEQLERRKTALEGLLNEVNLIRVNSIPEGLRQLRQRHAAAQLPDELWPRFAMQFAGNVDEAIAGQLQAVNAGMSAMIGQPVPAPDDNSDSLIPVGADMAHLSISLLLAESRRLENLIGVDKAVSQQLLLLNSRIATENGQAATLLIQIGVAERAPARIEEIKTERLAAYSKVFEALIAEQAQLAALYAPLDSRIGAETGAAQKLSFSVNRRVNVAAWGAEGEKLLDLRKGSTFGRGTLAEIASATLLKPWSTGSAEEATAALAAFRAHYDSAVVECCPYNLRDPSDAARVREWAGQISAWLHSTWHIEISYGIQFDGTDVERLSPGTRGIVLLLLYLVIDLDDNRPLLIDQPEENLDPKSIFVELVSRFRTAKQRRQIIIVTHNANLIVNADADQVIVASCGPHRPGELPELTYTGGGLEDPEIRAAVCDILEGGEAAFKERARRLRVAL